MTNASQTFAAPLLSFAIPTFNRAKHLDQLLGILLQQIHGESRIELIVSDNASTDSTSAVVEAYTRQGLAIRYLRNQANQGPDFNILQCYEQALGRYVWIFGDDDLIAPGTMKRVLDVLSTKQYDLVCIRPFFFEDNYIEHKKFDPLLDLELESAETLARHFHVFFTFVSGVILNKEYISRTTHRPFDSLIGTHLVQLGPLYTALNHHRRSLLIRDPLVAGTANTSVGYGLFEVFGTNLTRITSEWLENPSLKNAIMNGVTRSFFPAWILLSRQAGKVEISKDVHQLLRACFGHNIRYWLFNYPIAVLPFTLAKAWLTGVKAVNRITRMALDARLFGCS